VRLHRVPIATRSESQVSPQLSPDRLSISLHSYSDSCTTSPPDYSRNNHSAIQIPASQVKRSMAFPTCQTLYATQLSDTKAKSAVPAHGHARTPHPQPKLKGFWCPHEALARLNQWGASAMQDMNPIWPSLSILAPFRLHSPSLFVPYSFLPFDLSISASARLRFIITFKHRVHRILCNGHRNLHQLLEREQHVPQSAAVIDHGRSYCALMMRHDQYQVCRNLPSSCRTEGNLSLVNKQLELYRIVSRKEPFVSIHSPLPLTFKHFSLTQ
jgi:hypothetical protein